MNAENEPKIGIMLAIICHTIRGCGLVERNQVITAFRAMPTIIPTSIAGNILRSISKLYNVEMRD